MKLALKFFGLLFHIAGVILGGIVGYHVTIAAAPEWMTMWWIGYACLALTMIFYALAQFDS